MRDAPRSRLDYDAGCAPDFIVEARRVTEQCIMLQGNFPPAMAQRIAFWRWMARRRGEAARREGS